MNTQKWMTGGTGAGIFGAITGVLVGYGAHNYTQDPQISSETVGNVDIPVLVVGTVNKTHGILHRPSESPVATKTSPNFIGSYNSIPPPAIEYIADTPTIDPSSEAPDQADEFYDFIKDTDWYGAYKNGALDMGTANPMGTAFERYMVLSQYPDGFKQEFVHTKRYTEYATTGFVESRFTEEAQNLQDFYNQLSQHPELYSRISSWRSWQENQKSDSFYRNYILFERVKTLYIDMVSQHYLLQNHGLIGADILNENTFQRCAEILESGSSN